MKTCAKQSHKRIYFVSRKAARCRVFRKRPFHFLDNGIKDRTDHPLVLYVGNQLKGLINTSDCVQRIDSKALEGRGSQHLTHELSKH